MSADEKKIIADALAEATVFQRKTSRDAMDTALASLKAAGMTHNTLAPAELNRIRDAVKPVLAKFGQEAGPEFVAEVTGELAKLRK
ncbi:type 2 periplasmic-binding domain-containing protein [Elstera litoralis]|uniref:hypothetical protein n=1 Tax=Elstera litoralis TaxID=552518 RepID=UPI001E5FE3FD|nr:hypothetical protein [Elstera litoralis]